MEKFMLLKFINMQQDAFIKKSLKWTARLETRQVGACWSSGL